MDTKDKNIKEIRKVEKGINNNLFIICTIVTLASMTMMVVNFFSRGSFSPAKIGFFYLTVVLIYSLHKEFVRWLGEKKSRRQGEYFVYAWVLLTTTLYTINFFCDGYYSYSKEGYEVSTLADIAFTSMQVLGVFVLTRIMKIIFTFKGR